MGPMAVGFFRIFQVGGQGHVFIAVTIAAERLIVAHKTELGLRPGGGAMCFGKVAGMRKFRPGFEGDFGKIFVAI